MTPKLSQAALGRVLDLSPAAITKLKARGMPVHSAEAARAWRSAHIRRGHPTRTVEAHLNKSTATMTHDLLSARLLREQSDARFAELRAAEQDGRLMDREAMGRILAKALIAVRDALLALADRLAPVLAHESNPAAVHQTLYAEHHRALCLLADAGAEIARPK